MKAVGYLERLQDYHGQDVSWHIKNKSDVHTLADELIELGDEEFINQHKKIDMRRRIKKPLDDKVKFIPCDENRLIYSYT